MKKFILASGLLFFLIITSSSQACSNPVLKKDGTSSINPFGGWLIINGTNYDSLEIEYALGIKNVNNQGLIISFQPSSQLRDYFNSEPIFVEANSIKNITLKIWVGGKNINGIIDVNFVCEDGTPQYLQTYINLGIIGQGVSPPSSSTCDSVGLNGCYAGLYRNYYCSNDQLQYRATCTRICCQSFGGEMAFCNADNSMCILPDPNEKLNVEVHSPENKTYGSKKFLLNVSINNTVKNIYYALNSNKFVRLCQYCNSFKGQYYAKEGLNKLTIRAENYFGTYFDQNITFTVDSVTPSITLIEPKDESYVKGSMFKIKYSEDNLKNISLFYGETTFNEYVKYDCPSGRNKECNIEIDMSSYDGKKIKYYFIIRDDIHSTISGMNEIYVDSTKPVITINSPKNQTYINNKVSVEVKVSEEVVSLEMSDNGGRFRILCRNCNSYSRNTSFKEGTHNLILKAKDKAGNEVNSSVIFVIDYNKPSIRQIEPNNKTYIPGSKFTVYYDEDSVKDVSLFYGKEGEMKEYLMDYCPSGTRQECTAEVDLSEYDGEVIQYYFVIRSYLYEAVSDIYYITVDSTHPILTIISPLNEIYSSNRVMLNVDVSEKVIMESSDNNNRFSILCNDCNSYDVSRYFSYGTHNLTIRATDYAGNEGFASLMFTIKR